MAHIEDDDFFLVYGNPVVVNCDDGHQLVCIAWPLVERYMRMIGCEDKADELSQQIEEYSSLSVPLLERNLGDNSSTISLAPHPGSLFYFLIWQSSPVCGKLTLSEWWTATCQDSTSAVVSR